jgi:hypothetical protein
MRTSDFENCFPVRPVWRIRGEAADGIQGIEKAKALRPAIVLLDVSSRFGQPN